MSPHSRLPDWIKRLFTSPVNELNRWQLAARYTLDLGIHCAKALQHDKAMQMAAALTYHTLFSLLPTLVLVLLFLGSIRGLEHYSAQFKDTIINFLLPETMLSIESGREEDVTGGPLGDVNLPVKPVDGQAMVTKALEPFPQAVRDDPLANDLRGLMRLTTGAVTDGDDIAYRRALADVAAFGVHLRRYRDVPPHQAALARVADRYLEANGVPKPLLPEVAALGVYEPRVPTGRDPPDQPVPVRPDTDRPDAALAQAEEIAARQEFNKARRQMADRIQETLDHLSRVSFGSIGVVGLLAFLYGATSLLETIERSFNDIFGVAHSRPLGIRIPRYFTLVTVGPLFIILGQVMQQQFLNLIEADALTSWLAGPLVVLSPLLGTWLALFLLFVMMPNTYVQRRAAAVGAFISAGLWLVGKEAFATYVVSAAISTLYGALALLPLFMMWVYITWLIALFGLELTYTLQHMKGRRFKHEQAKQFDDVMLDPAWVVPIAATIAESFERGEPTRVNAMADALRLPNRAVRRLLAALESAGIVHKVELAAATAYTLARPADRTPLSSVIEAARSLLPDRDDFDDHDPAWRFVDRLYDRQTDLAQAQTLADVCEACSGNADTTTRAEPPVAPRRDTPPESQHDDERLHADAGADETVEAGN